jgi:DNA-binding PadR family transcriptional regulator
MSVSHAILGLLLEGERHGYEMASKLAERIPSGPYNHGQIHQALEQIEQRGWAVSRSDSGLSRNRRPFSITPKGRQEFQAWLNRPVAVGRPVRDEIVVKLVFLGQHDPARLVEVLEQRRREYRERLAEVQVPTTTAPGQPLDARLGQLVLDGFRFRAEAEVRWVEHCLAVLRPYVEAHQSSEDDAVPPPVPFRAAAEA